MIPRLQAGEMLSTSAAMALGGGNLERRDARRLRSELQRQANGGRHERAAPASPLVLGMMGIGVEEAPHHG